MDRKELENLEKSVLIEIIFTLTEEVKTLTERVLELERRLNQNSSNSSLPPSSDKWKKPQSERSKGGKVGGQAGHKGKSIKIEREPDEVRELKPQKCAKCGEELAKAGGNVTEVRNKIDVEIRTKITRYEQIGVVCPCCGKEKEFAEKCEPVAEEIKEAVKGSEVAHYDETSASVNGKKHWIHTASTKEATYNTVHRSRGKEGTDDNGVLKEFGGVSVHDCLPQYFGYTNCLHAVCNAHLLRELQGVIENTGQQWAVDMSVLLREMKMTVDDFKGGDRTGLPDEYIKWFGEEYKRIITMGEAENPLTEEQKRKKTAKRSKQRNLLDRFIEYREEITRFTENFAVPFDNNQAERDIRNAKTKLKVSGSFRSEQGAENFATTSSVIGTAVKQGAGVFKTVSDIFTGSFKSIFRKTQTEQ
jgi:transposase